MPFLDWVNKNQAKQTSSEVPYRLLQQEQSFGDNSNNLLIQGDNLAALKALKTLYEGEVKCIFIDPPYNTQSAFSHYDDKLEHSQWLSMMYPRLSLLKDLLAEDGSIWIHLDDNEAHYNRVLMDEIFGRSNFVANIVWQKSYAVRSNAEFFSTSVEHINVHCKQRRLLRIGRIGRSADQLARFENPDNDPRGAWQSVTMTISLTSGARGRQFARTGTSPNLYTVTSPSGQTFNPPPGRCWSRLEPEFARLDREGRIWWGRGGRSAPRLKMYLSESDDGVIPTTLWASGEQFGFNQDGIRELRALELDFPTPKPERLLQRVLELCTNPGDLVLDSFLGSGTTAAVAHKMGRRWIGIEMGEHARTHCVPRLQKVIDGEQGGISEAVGWKGGGGFRFYTLGEAIFDEHGHINQAVQFPALAAYVWHLETRTPGTQAFESPLLGVHNGTAYYLLFNGILGDRRPAGGNVLTQPVLQHLKELGPHDGPRVIYGESSRLGPARLAAEGTTFKQIPYDIKMR